MPRINLLKDASTDRLYANVTAVRDKTSCDNVSGFGVISVMPRQTQSCKVLENEIVVMTIKAPVVNKQHIANTTSHQTKNDTKNYM